MDNAWAHRTGYNETAYSWVCQHSFNKAKTSPSTPTKRKPKQIKPKPNPANINTQMVIKPPIAFLADPYIEFISSPNFSEWSIFPGDVISSRLLTRKLGVRNQDSCCKEKLLLQFFFKMVYAIKFQGVLVFSLQIHHFAPFSSPQFQQKQQAPCST